MTETFYKRPLPTSLIPFASAEGRLGGDFYTPQSVVRVMVEAEDAALARQGAEAIAAAVAA